MRRDGSASSICRSASIDTRGGSRDRCGDEFRAPDGLLTVMAKPRANGAGEADVYPCGATPDAEPTFRFDE